MRLLSLSAEHFRGIRSAKVQFGPGLNVLHGPNDLGKSSLATAIRAVLLMQASAKEHEALVDWSGAGDPHVELVFETGPQRIWRVRKTFGSSGAQAFLDESRNGVDFHLEARGREVDGRLSQILRWGLAPPGGKGRPKGLPVTFLSAALLAEQDQVAAILESGLATDSDESGKKRLIEALQAVAEDPLFKRVLDRVQERVDEAFSSTGRKRLGKNSPWVRIREEIARADVYHQQCSEQSHKTVAIELELQQLLQEQMERKASVDHAAGVLEQIERSHASGKLRQEILGRLEDCNKRLAEIATTMKDLAEAEEVQVRLARQVEQLRQKEQWASEALADASQKVQAAKDNLAMLESEDRERERLLKQASLEKRQAELRTALSENNALITRLQTVEAAARRVQTLDDEYRGLATTIQHLEEEHKRSKEAARKAGEREQALRSIAHLFQIKVARTEVEAAKKGLAQVTEWREEIGRNRATAAALEAALGKLTLPSAAQLEDIRQLDHQLRVARAKVSVGLHLEVRPKRKMKVSVRRDSEAPERHALHDIPWETSASRSIAIDLEDIAEIAVSGGSGEDRGEADRLQQRWDTEVGPVLANAGTDRLDELMRTAAEAAARTHEMGEALREADRLELRVGDQRDWASVLASRGSEIATAEEALGTVDEEKLEGEAQRLGIQDPAGAESRINKVRTERGKLEESEREMDSKRTAALATSMEKEKAVAAAHEELARAQAGIEDDWRQLLPAVRANANSLKDESEEIEREIEALFSEAGRGLTEARNAAAEAEKLREAAVEAHRRATEDLRNSEKQHATGEGELKMRREAAAKLDEGAARLAVEHVKSELQQTPAPASEITDEMLEQAKQMVHGARAHLRDIETEILGKRGALQHVGGDVAKQRADEAADALNRVRQREQDLENDYAAWELLRNTLRDAEQEEGVHLGRTLGGPIARRFSDLTEQRYGPVSLGPDLETHGISASGEARLVSALSVGTRDQLSTIFRLTLAEQLHSAVILDDQLTQSDTERMAWLRDLIRKLGGGIQILVFTCRPGDYLLAAELKPGKKAEPTASLVRSIDLTRIIERSGPGAGASTVAG